MTRLVKILKPLPAMPNNVEVTQKIVHTAHAIGISAQGELGVLGSLETYLAGEEDGSAAKGILGNKQLLT